MKFRDHDFKNNSKSRNKDKNMMDNKTTSKTKPNEKFKNDVDYINKLKDKQSNGTESGLRQFLPGEIGHYEDDNMLSLFRNTNTNESKLSISKLSKKFKRSSMAATGYTTPDMDTNVQSTVLKTLTHSYKDSFSTKGQEKPPQAVFQPSSKRTLKNGMDSHNSSFTTPPRSRTNSNVVFGSIKKMRKVKNKSSTQKSQSDAASITSKNSWMHAEKEAGPQHVEA